MLLLFVFFFFFNDTATTEIYTLSLHDALPISRGDSRSGPCRPGSMWRLPSDTWSLRSEEHTSELQSHHDLVCRLLLEKKKKIALHLHFIEREQLFLLNYHDSDTTKRRIHSLLP